MGILILALIFLALLPAMQVGCVRYIDPWTTGTMLQRRIEASIERSSRTPLRLQWTPADQVPGNFFRFVWVAEDQRFFQHDGFDWVEMRIVWEEAREQGAASRGASTITMQAARSLFLWQDRGAPRKLLEAYYTIWMEWLLEKERILELYVNVVELGPGVFGIGAAAEEFYGKPAAQLSRSECAMLAALLPAPLAWSPREPSPGLLKRQQRILQRAERAPIPPELRSMGVN